VEVAGQSTAVFNIAGRYYAIGNTCPHRDGPLAEGMMAGEEVSEGAASSKKGVSFPIRVTGEDLEVDIE
jgi:nitrite reductase/ring-hydroxylating ferredoxin subunit